MAEDSVPLATANPDNMEEHVDAELGSTETTSAPVQLDGADMINLGVQFQDEYIETGNPHFLEQAVEANREAMKVISEDQLHWKILIYNFGLILIDKYNHTKSLEHLEEAIQLTEKAFYEMGSHEVEHFSILLNLTTMHNLKYAHTGCMDDLDRAIQFRQLVVDLAPEDAPDMPTYLINLAVCHKDKARSIDSLKCIDEGLDRLREAYELAPESHPQRLLSLRYIGILRFHRYKLTGGSIGDLEESIEVGRDVIQSMEQDDVGKANALEDLSDRLWTSYSDSKKQMAKKEGPQLTTAEVNERPASQPRDNTPMDPEAESPAIDPNTSAEMHLEESILMLKLALKIENKRDKCWANRQNKLCRQLYTKYRKTGDVSDIMQSITAAKEAIEATEDPNDRSGTLIQTGVFMMEMFQKFGRHSDIEEAIRLAKEAAEITPREHKDWPRFQSSAGLWMGYQYSKDGNMDILDEGICLARDAAADLPSGHRHKASCSMNLARLLDKRFTKMGQLIDCEESIKSIQEAIDSTPLGHEDRPAQLMELGWQLGQKYVQTRAESDLQNAIENTRGAIDHTPKSSPDRAHVLYNLGHLLVMKYTKSGLLSDLEEAIDALSEGLLMVPADHDIKPKLLANLAESLRNRYVTTKDSEDLNKSIRLAQESVDLTDESSKSMPNALFELASSLWARHDANPNMHDMDEAIRVQKDALARVWKEHPNRHGYLNNLALGLHRRYLTTRNLEDLDECIRLSEESTKAAPEGHQDWFDHMNNLGDFLRTRYSSIGRLMDLDEAIWIGYKLQTESCTGQRNRDIYLSSLSLRLHDRYSRTNKDSDLNEAIEIAREAASLTNDDKEIMQDNSINLGTWLFGRYRALGHESDYEAAHDTWKQALESPALDDSSRRSILQNLCVLLTHRYRHSTKKIIDIETAIDYGREAVRLSDPSGSRLAGRAANLGDALGAKYSHTKDSETLDEAISMFRKAMEHPNATVNVKLLAGRELIYHLALDDKFQDSLEVARATIALIPKLISRSLNNAEKQQLLLQVRNISSEAASAALNAGEEPSAALSLLEQGRGIIATSIQDSRADIDKLKLTHPDLATRFSNAKEQMDQSQATLPAEITPALSQEWVDENFEKVLVEIRQIVGFEDFFGTPTTSRMREAADRGPVAVINTSRLRCDAILVEKHQIQCLPLQRLSLDKIMAMADEARRGPASQDILEWMWDDIIHPILDKLGFDQCPTDGDWPHIWWIPTGLLTHFPLHAAGYHLGDSFETALDRVMSSYSTSIKAMLFGRRQPAAQPSDGATAVLVAMDATDGHNSLPLAPREIEEVAKVCVEMGITAIKPPQRKADVLSQLQNCTIFHFAGHGHTDKADPAMSRLLLKDDAKNPFTVASLMDLDHERSPFLAYLSACGTGRIKDERLLDESIHLVGACQIAGFRHVIGTLWGVQDDMCVDMAKGTYKVMLDGNMTDESVCLGIHSATRTLRDKWRSGHKGDGEDRQVRDASMVEDDSMLDASKWAPYVHFGV